MKKFKTIAIVALMVLIIPFITACDKRQEVKFDGEEGTVTFAPKESYGCKLSTNKEDFRNSREQGMVICNNFKVSIEFDDISYFFPKGFSQYKEKRKADYKDLKEITYSGIKTVQYFYGGYNDYEVTFPVEGNDKYVLHLSVYGNKDTEKAAKDAINSEEVQDFLNNISGIAVK